MNPDKDIFPLHHNKESFKVPTDYFVESKNEIFSSLVDPTIDVESGNFQVPEGYFELLNSEIKTKIVAAPQKGKILQYTFWSLAVAASIMLFFVMFQLIPEKECESFTCLLDKTDFHADDLLFIDEEIIAEFYLEYQQEQEWDDIANKQTNFDTEVSDTISTEENNINPNDISDELLDELDIEDFYFEE